GPMPATTPGVFAPSIPRAITAARRFSTLGCLCRISIQAAAFFPRTVGSSEFTQILVACPMKLVEHRKQAITLFDILKRFVRIVVHYRPSLCRSGSGAETYLGGSSKITLRTPGKRAIAWANANFADGWFESSLRYTIPSSNR